MVWLKVVKRAPKQRGESWRAMTTRIGAQSKQKSISAKAARQVRMNADSQNSSPSFSARLPPLGGKKWIPVGGICSGLSFVQNRNYFSIFTTLGQCRICQIVLSSENANFPQADFRPASTGVQPARADCAALKNAVEVMILRV